MVSFRATGISQALDGRAASSAAALFETLRSAPVSATIASLFLAYALGSLLYATLLHPLRGFPGSTLHAVTRIPYWIATLSGEQARWLHKLHIRYGPVVRYGPNDLSYADADAWKEVLHGSEKGRKENPKDPYIDTLGRTVKNIIVANPTDHARVRRILSPAFSDRALREQLPLFQKHIDLLVMKLREASGQPIDMTRMLNCTTFDIMGDLSFGQPLGLLESSEYSPWLASVFAAIQVNPLLQFINYYPLVKAAFDLFEPRRIKDLRDAHFNYTSSRVDRRLKEGSDKPDIWNLAIGDDDKGLTLDEMYANSEVFLLAGSETTASALAAVHYHLLVNPAKLKRVTGEVRGALAGKRAATLEALANLKYLNGCIQEGLRMYPPVPTGIPRRTPEGGNTVLGRWVAPGTSLMVFHTGIYRSPKYWRDPDTFAPERWLGDDERYKDDRRDALQPFSLGPRNCIGQNMAWHEMRLILANMVLNFDLELCDGQGDWLHQRVFIVWEKKPLMCRLTPVTR